MHRLYKYYPPETALNVLQQQTLRFSAPHLLGELFCPDHNAEVDFSAGELIHWLSDYLVELLFAESSPAPRTTSTPLLQTLLQWRDTDHFKSRAEAYQHLQPLIRPLVRHFFIHAEDSLNQWRYFARQVRIGCYCQQPDNLFAWQHYGDQHRGIALGFTRAKFSKGMISRPLSYHPQPARLIDAQPQLDRIAASEFVAPRQNEFIELLCHKSLDQQQEAEWREFKLPAQDESGDCNIQDCRYWYNEETFSKQSLEALYIGAATDISWQRSLIEFTKKHYPSTDIYRWSPAPGQYALQRETLHTGQQPSGEPPILTSTVNAPEQTRPHQ
ncbi:hypothetical protein EDC56_3899 [Sinobacterium caligoides]|uniref:DUF2971 family protein n=1 Tax=Sinobacterium caligoides TaxID=933926 RepID=A0A3N2D4M9_9GAMM|nr:DUF2971 domain-containing protein [Sinobacterium caligoides]ROR94756.1 hypothetical protein EDC56_3899 [Sinobacterium caligoides]